MFRQGEEAEAGEGGGPRRDREVPQGARASVPRIRGEAHGLQGRRGRQDRPGHEAAHRRHEQGRGQSQGTRKAFHDTILRATLIMFSVLQIIQEILKLVYDIKPEIHRNYRR